MGRAEDTKQALIEAAGREFARHGFDGASTRAIADRAGVNLGAIHYHFGGKEQLYLATFRQTLKMEERDALREDSAYDPAEPLSVSRTIEAWVRQDFQDLLLGARDDWHMPLMLRELSAPSSAYGLLVESLFRSRHEHWLRLYRSVRPQDPERAAHLWAIQVGAAIVFQLNTGRAIEVLMGRAMHADDIEALIVQTARAMITQLDLPLPEHLR